MQILLDPYAKYVKGRSVFGRRDEFEQFKTKVRSAGSGGGGGGAGTISALCVPCHPALCVILYFVARTTHPPAAAGGQRVPRHL